MLTSHVPGHHYFYFLFGCPSSLPGEPRAMPNVVNDDLTRSDFVHDQAFADGK